MPAADRPSRGTGKATAADLTKSRPKPKLSKVMPEVWKLVKPRRVVLSVSFLLMIVNRASGLVLPGSMRYLIDNVMTKGQLSKLPLIVGAVVSATILQGVTSYALTQLLSKAGQRLITDLRMQVQAHIGKLPVAFYDENRTGTLVARIMTDVEGVRNLIGTGVIDFFGGLLTAIFAFCYLIRLSYQMTLLDVCDSGGVWADFAEGFQDDSADFPGAREDQCGGDGPVDGVAWRRTRGEGLPCRG